VKVSVSLALEFERTPAGIRNQLQKMKLVNASGAETDLRRKPHYPRTKCVYGTPGTGMIWESLRVYRSGDRDKNVAQGGSDGMGETR